MAAVSVTSVAVLNNPGLFTEPLQFEIQYECLTALAHGETPILDITSLTTGNHLIISTDNEGP